MASLLHVGLGNAAAATALALAAGLVCGLLRGRRPAVTHALWLLVLLKLLTPPLWTLPVPWFQSASPQPTVVQTSPRLPREPAPAREGDIHEAPGVEPPTIWFSAVEPPDRPVPNAVSRPVREHFGAAFDVPEVTRWLPEAISAAWLAGSLCCLALVVLRSWRFRRLLRHATGPAPDVIHRTAALSNRLGIPVPPEVLMVPGAICPMLWAVLGRPRLLLPAGLWDDLDEAQRDTLIAHELAHLRRRDHWARLVEVAATVLYWWHPAVWWARRELRDAEEQCCDAWVVWSLPRCARPYMNAILKAVDFVSDAAADCAGRARVAVPPVASGMASGEFRHLERRLSMIRQNENRSVAPAGRTLGRAALVSVCAAAAGFLPMAPSLAQQEPQQPRSITVVAAPRAGNEGPVYAELQVRPVPNSAMIELRAPEQNFVVRATPEAPVGTPGEAAVSVNGASIRLSKEKAEAEEQHTRSEVERARHDVQRLTAELEAARARLATAEAVAGQAGNQWGPNVLSRRGPSVGGMFFRGEPQAPATVRRGAAPDPQRRLDELERKLDRLLDEVRNLKDGRRGRGESSTPPVSQAY